MERKADRAANLLHRLRHRLPRVNDEGASRRVRAIVGRFGLRRTEGHPVGSGGGWLIDRLADLLHAAEPSVAVLHDGTSMLPARLVRFIPGVMVHSFGVSERAEVLHTRMAAHGPYRVIIDDTGRRGARAALFKNCFWHLSAGGTYVVRRFRAGARSAEGGRAKVQVGQLIARAATGARRRPDSSLPPRPEYDRARLRCAIGRVVIERGHIFVKHKGSAYPKVREKQVGLLLAERGAKAGAVLTTVEAADLRTRCTWRPWPLELTGRERPVYHAPEMSLREYRGVVCAPEQVVVQGHAVLPDSYRHNASPRLRNKALPEVARRFAAPRSSLDPTRRLRGAYFYLDNEHRGHFGHMLTEQVAKLWAWEEAQRRHPDLKALVALNRDRDMSDWEYLLLSAAGIDRSDVVVIWSPVEVDTLLAATPMFSHPAYVHPAIAATWRRVGDALAARASSRDQWPRRIFCSRRITSRSCHNTGEVERIFSSHGFGVVYTEDYSIPDQVSMFRNAEVVAGFAGSALFNLCWATEPKRVVIVASASYTARNEYMIGAVLGHEIDFITGRPDIPQPEQGWSRQAFVSGFTFDSYREGVYLEELLSAL